MLCIIVSVLCCVMQAAESPDESTQPRSCVQKKSFSRENLRTKIQASLAQKERVRVFYFPTEYERYSATYDVSSDYVRETFWLPKTKTSKTAIFPVTYAFQQEFLKGFVLKPGQPVPCITDVDFSEQNVDSNDYCQQKFCSGVLEQFLTEIFQKLADKRKAHFDCDEMALNTAMITPILQKQQNKRCLWKVVSEDEALDLWHENPKDQEVFLIIGGVGLLWGRLSHPCAVQIEIPKSLFSHKIACVLDGMCAKYPFSEKKWRTCLDYNGKKQTKGDAEATERETSF